MHYNIILSEAGAPRQLKVRFFISFLQLKHFYLPISLEIPGKEKESLAFNIIEHELNVVLVFYGEELSYDAVIAEL